MVVLQAVMAAMCDAFTKEQMEEEGVTKGIPFVAHTGMWSDVFIVSPLLAILITKYVQRIDLAYWMVGVAVSLFHHRLYVRAPFPEAHVAEGKLTPAGWMHAAYMAIAFTVILQFYLGVTPEPQDVYFVGPVLMVHVVVAVHVPLKILKPSWFPYHGILNKDTLVPIAVSAAVLVALSWYALV